jgi:hypothetical protein
MEKRRAGPGRFDLSKAAFFTVLGCSVVGLSFTAGLHAGSTRNAVYRVVTAVGSTIQNSLLLAAQEAPTFLGIHPTHFLQPSRNEGNGVTINDASNGEADLILLSGFFTHTNELRLVKRTGEVVARWPVQYYRLFQDDSPFPPDSAPATDWNVDTHGALALPDGSVVFNFEWGGLVKLDRCGNVVWKLHQRTHHSVERAEGGGFWVPARRTLEGESPFPPFQTPFDIDTILRVSEDGRVLGEVSVPQILYDNDLEAILTATGEKFTVDKGWDHELVHVNKVAELTSSIAGDFPLFEAGDLAISIREHNLVMVVDKNADRVKWWKVGPWVRQHDPEFKAGGTLVVFNNNAYEHVFGWDIKDQLTPPSTPRVSTIVEVNPASGSTQVIYGGREGQAFLSVVRGKVELTPRGGLLITEEDGGRVFETDASGKIVWEYVNRYSANWVAEVTEARLYAASYFTVKDWSCEFRER